MKKIISIIALIVLLMSCACAEGVGTEMWQHEAGWVSASLAMSWEGLEEAWDKATEAFAERMGLKGLEAAQLKTMMLKGYSMESGVDELGVEGDRFVGRNADGTEAFAHEYAFVETLENKDILGGVKVFVFRTEEKNAGDYTYLLMTEPVKTEGEGVSYTTFNLICTGRKDYRNLFKGKNVVVPCPMIEKDTGNDGVAYMIERVFTAPLNK